MGWMRSGERRGTVVLLVIVGLIVASMALWRAGNSDEYIEQVDFKIEKTDTTPGMSDSVDRAGKPGRANSRKKKHGKKIEKKRRDDVVIRDYLDERIDEF